MRRHLKLVHVSFILLAQMVFLSCKDSQSGMEMSEAQRSRENHPRSGDAVDGTELESAEVESNSSEIATIPENITGTLLVSCEETKPLKNNTLEIGCQIVSEEGEVDDDTLASAEWEIQQKPDDTTKVIQSESDDPKFQKILTFRAENWQDLNDALESSLISVSLVGDDGSAVVVESKTYEAIQRPSSTEIEELGSISIDRPTEGIEDGNTILPENQSEGAGSEDSSQTVENKAKKEKQLSPYIGANRMFGVNELAGEWAILGGLNDPPSAHISIVQCFANLQLRNCHKPAGQTTFTTCDDFRSPDILESIRCQELIDEQGL